MTEIVSGSKWRNATSDPGQAAYRVEVSLVELVHSSLQLAALALPLLEVADRLHGGALPRGGARVVVHVVDPAAVVDAALPTGEGRGNKVEARDGWQTAM